uniref:Uncharacterized protein n=1 Tax=Gopherus evgoodei TaxID=1825980 RepID=A0A8C4Y673_9SAUR
TVAVGGFLKGINTWQQLENINKEGGETKNNKQEGKPCVAEDLQLGSGLKASRGPMIPIHGDNSCPTPHHRNKVIFGHEQKNLI